MNGEQRDSTGRCQCGHTYSAHVRSADGDHRNACSRLFCPCDRYRPPAPSKGRPSDG